MRPAWWGHVATVEAAQTESPDPEGYGRPHGASERLDHQHLALVCPCGRTNREVEDERERVEGENELLK